MLHIIYLMLLLSIYQDETISCYFAVAFQRARLSVGQGRPWLFFLCFIRQVLRLLGDTVVGSGQPPRALPRERALLWSGNTDFAATALNRLVAR
jgi:hypothetical protein